MVNVGKTFASDAFLMSFFESNLRCTLKRAYFEKDVVFLTCKKSKKNKSLGGVSARADAMPARLLPRLHLAGD